MSSFTLYDATSSSFKWEIGLTSAFNSTNYQEVILTNRNAGAESASKPSSTILTRRAPSSGSSWYTSGSFTGQSPSTTYDLWAYAQSNNGKYYRAGTTGKSITTLQEPKRRPNDWSWGRSFSQGSNIGAVYERNGVYHVRVMEAYDWNRFTQRIEAFRDYEGYTSSYGFTTASSGDLFGAWIFNQAVNAIDGMRPPTWAPSTKSKGDRITAYDFNKLRDALNSIR